VTGNSGPGAQPPSYGSGPAGPPYGPPPGGTPPAAPPPYGPQAPQSPWSSQPRQQQPGPYGWQPGYGPQPPVTGQPPWGQPPRFPPPRRRGRLGIWLGIGGAAVAIIVIAAVALSTGTGNHSSPPSSGPSTAPSGKSAPCPSTPAAGPAHTLTFPQSVGGYQLATGPTNSTEVTFLGNNGCTLPEQGAFYQDSQGDSVGVQAGHHANLWHNFNSFWGPYFGASDAKIAPVAAGPLGGQAYCGTISDATSCNWLDNDTFGLVISNGMSASQIASLMVTFRNAIEQSG
jgi:hypothetical protein